MKCLKSSRKIFAVIVLLCLSVVAFGVFACGNNVVDVDKEENKLIYVEIEGGYSVRVADKTGLSSVVVPNTYNDRPVINIGSGAFYNCDSLTSVTIPSSITSIDSYAFYGCDSLTIYCEVENKPSDWKSDWNNFDYPVVWDCKNNDKATDGYIYTVIGGVRYGLKDDTATVVMQSSILRDAVIAESVIYKNVNYDITTIGSGAFNNCDSLESITLPFVGASRDGISNTHFGYIFGAQNAYDSSNFIPSSLKTVIITGGVNIKNYAFYDCSSLTSVNS